MDIYVGGEKHVEKQSIPKHFEYFLNKKRVFGVLILLIIFLLIKSLKVIA